MSVEPGGIDRIRVGRVDGMAAAFTAGSPFEFHCRDPAAASAEVNDSPEAPVVLHRAVDAERRIHVISNVEKLAEREVMSELSPCFPSIIRDHDSAVIDIDDVVRIVGVDPHAVVIDMHSPERTVRFSAVIGHT
ncbi:hypothetical protein ES703_59865 [subsurface metagenome]